jgi:Flp pilus assembly pilin Flp
MTAPRRLLADRRGASAIEFALVALPLLLLVVGVFEFAVMTAVAAMLESAALEAARFGATGQLPAGMTREARVREIVAERTHGLVDTSRLEITVLVYEGFDRIDQPESYDDANGNGIYDPGESFEDVNGNGTWDADQGRAGLGGSGDVVVYELVYPWTGITGLMAPLFDGRALTSSVPVRNEPF